MLGGIKMAFEELLSVLKETNKKRKDPISEKILEEILALVMKNPLNDDRTTCQAQIDLLIKQRVGGQHNEN